MFTLKIDKILEEVSNSISPFIYKKIIEIIGDKENLYKLESTSKKLDINKFNKINEYILAARDNIVNKILRVVNDEIKDYKEFLSTNEISDYMDRIQKSIDLIIKGISNELHQSLLESVLLTYDENKIKETAEKLKSKVTSTFKSSFSLISEVVIREIRSNNENVMSKAEEEGDMYIFSHVIDSHTSDICLRLGNQIMSKEDWIKTKSDIFTIGGHHGCRGVMALIKEDDIKKIKEDVSTLTKKADKILGERK